MNDKIIGKGSVRFTLVRGNGKIEQWTVDNLIVTTGSNHMANLLAGGSNDPISHMALGEGGTAPVLSNNALESEISRQALTSTEQGSGIDANKVIYTAGWAPGEGTGALVEAGLFNASTAGTMLSRTIFPVRNKGASDTLTLVWTLTIN